MRTDFEQSGQDYAKIKKQLVMLKPKLAYAAGRQMAVKSNFYPFMKNAIEGVEKAEKEGLDQKVAMEHFFLLVESVVAYHKFHGGE